MGPLASVAPPRIAWGSAAMVLAVTALFTAQIAVGTDWSFALAVAVSLLTSIATFRFLGASSIASFLIASMMLRYLVVSQIAKTILGQPGDSNLAAPETTAYVIMIGTLSVCVGAGLVAMALRNRRLLQFDPSLPQLLALRNVCLVIGGSATLIAYLNGTTDINEVDYGGVGAIANEFASLVILAVMADTWIALRRSDGRHSTSPTLIILLCILSLYGLASNSKQGTAQYIIAYYLASIALRRSITRPQLLFGFGALAIGVGVLYPLNQMARGRIAVTHSGGIATVNVIQDFIRDPGSVLQEWELLTSTPIEKVSLAEQGLFYLGTEDILLGRFLLIANTDVIVNAVNENGLYGLDLLTHGFLIIVPTVLLPDKPRIQTCDLIMWFYGLQPDLEQPGNPTIGLFADCFAAMSWAGVVIFPALMMLIFLPMMQLFGTKIPGNIIGIYLIMKYVQVFDEAQLEEFVGYSIRGIPFDVLKILVVVYIANRFFVIKSSGGAR